MTSASCRRTQSKQPLVVAERMPGPDVQTDDELLDYARANGSTVYHASCSCMMGDHQMAVAEDIAKRYRNALRELAK